MRSRLYRQRQRNGRRILHLEISKALLSRFVEVGLLSPDEIKDDAAMESAIATLCAEALKARQAETTRNSG